MACLATLQLTICLICMSVQLVTTYHHRFRFTADVNKKLPWEKTKTIWYLWSIRVNIYSAQVYINIINCDINCDIKTACYYKHFITKIQECWEARCPTHYDSTTTRIPPTATFPPPKFSCIYIKCIYFLFLAEKRSAVCLWVYLSVIGLFKSDCQNSTFVLCYINCYYCTLLSPFALKHRDSLLV